MGRNEVGSGKIGGIQGLRAIAAFQVIIQHSIFYACVAKGVDFNFYLPVWFRQIGVEIFFVISGYVMTLCLPQGIMFMPQRVARVYPAYWFAIILNGLLLPLIGRDWHLDGYALTLLPTSFFDPSYAVPSWTLVYEVFFYAIMALFAFFHLSRRQIVAALILWAIVIAFVCQFGIRKFPHDASAMMAGKWIFISPTNLEFIGGALYGLVGCGHLKSAKPVSLAIQALILLIIAQKMTHLPYYFRCCLWAATFTLVLHLVKDIRVPRILQMAGNYSYGLYLTHVIFIDVTMYVMVRFWPQAPLVAFLLAAISAALVGGLTFGALEFSFHTSLIKPALRKISSHRTMLIESAGKR